MSTVAFAIRKTIDADSFAGSVTLPDGVLFNVGEAFEQSPHVDEDDGKVFVTSDAAVIDALNPYPPLKHVAVPESAKGEIVHAPRVHPNVAGTSGEANEGVAPESDPADSGESPASDEPEGEVAPEGDTVTPEDTADAQTAEQPTLELPPLGTRGLFMRGDSNTNRGE